MSAVSVDTNSTHWIYKHSQFVQLFFNYLNNSWHSANNRFTKGTKIDASVYERNERLCICLRKKRKLMQNCQESSFVWNSSCSSLSHRAKLQAELWSWKIQVPFAYSTQQVPRNSSALSRRLLSTAYGLSLPFSQLMFWELPQHIASSKITGTYSFISCSLDII